jgi:signal transduction histidine kinase
VKHAAARTVRLEIGRVPDGVRIAVIDDGAGFETGSVPPGHLGLAGMRARAERIGGRFRVESRPGQGTTIEVVVPAEVG